MNMASPTRLLHSNVTSTLDQNASTYRNALEENLNAERFIAELNEHNFNVTAKGCSLTLGATRNAVSKASQSQDRGNQKSLDEVTISRYLVKH